MKITITQIVIEFPEEESVPVPPANPLDFLLERLLFEVQNGRNAKQWDQHAAGPQSPPGPSDGRQYRNVYSFNQGDETT